jgi:hypothetical protein
LHGWAPPKPLGERIRWFLLLPAMVNLCVSTVRLVAEASGTRPLEAALMVATAVFLIWWWLRGYRRQSYPMWAAVPEGPALFASASAATSTPPRSG